MSRSFSLGVLVTVATSKIMADTNELCNFMHYILGHEADLDNEKLMFNLLQAKVLTDYPELGEIRIDRPITCEQDCMQFLSTLIARGYKHTYEVESFN